MVQTYVCEYTEKYLKYTPHSCKTCEWIKSCQSEGSLMGVATSKILLIGQKRRR